MIPFFFTLIVVCLGVYLLAALGLGLLTVLFQESDDKHLGVLGRRRKASREAEAAERWPLHPRASNRMS